MQKVIQWIAPKFQIIIKSNALAKFTTMTDVAQELKDLKNNTVLNSIPDHLANVIYVALSCGTWQR